MSAQIQMPAFAPEPGAAVRRVAAETERNRARAFLGAVLRTALAAVTSALLSLAAWQGYGWATSSTAFKVARFTVGGNAHVAEGDLLRRSGLFVGENIFRADLARAVRGIESHPWVVSARLERRLPDTIAVEVLEHRPLALVQLGGLYVLDDQARLFKRAAADDQLDLPLVTGLSRGDWEEKRPEQKLRLLTALQLLDAWKAQGFGLRQLSELRFEDDSVTLFAHDGEVVQEIRLGDGEFALKLKRLAQMRAALTRRGERAVKIDLDNPSRPDQATAALAQKHR